MNNKLNTGDGFLLFQEFLVQLKLEEHDQSHFKNKKEKANDFI